MANTKSAEKAARQSRKRQIANRVYVGGARTAVKKARTALAGSDQALSEAAVLEAMSVLDRAAQKGVIHRNNAARRKSRLAKALAKAQAAS